MLCLRWQQQGGSNVTVAVKLSQLEHATYILFLRSVSPLNPIDWIPSVSESSTYVYVMSE
jgi:hypothetical protein